MHDDHYSNFPLPCLMVISPACVHAPSPRSISIGEDSHHWIAGIGAEQLLERLFAIRSSHS